MTLAEEIDAAVNEYRTIFPEPYSLPPNLTLATRAAAVLHEIRELADAISCDSHCSNLGADIRRLIEGNCQMKTETVATAPNGDLHVTDNLGRTATLHWSRFHGLIVEAHGAVYLSQPEVKAWLREHLPAATEVPVGATRVEAAGPLPTGSEM